MKKLKSIPRFKNEDEEREFWAKHDTTEYFDTSKPIQLNLTKLKRSTKSVTVRLPEALIRTLKMLANKQDVPYQSLLKMFLTEKVREVMLGKRIG